MRQVVVELDLSKLTDRTRKNNSPWFKEAQKFIESAMMRSRLFGRLKLKPLAAITLTEEAIAELHGNRVRFKFRPGGGSSAWEYAVFNASEVEITAMQIISALTGEISNRIDSKPIDVSKTPLNIPMMARGSLGIPNPKPKNSEPIKAKEQKPVATPQSQVTAPTSSQSLMDAMAEMIRSAVDVEAWQSEIAEKRSVLAKKNDFLESMRKEVSLIEDEIAALELKIDGNPEARKASAFLEAMSSLVKGRK